MNLVGITDGTGDVGQALTITAVSSNPAVIPNPAVNYASPSASGQITYTPVPNTSGTAVILVTVMDNGGTQNGGINTVTPVVHGYRLAGQPGAHAGGDSQP